LRLDVEGSGVVVAELPDTIAPARVPFMGASFESAASPRVMVPAFAREFHPERHGLALRFGYLRRGYPL